MAVNWKRRRYTEDEFREAWASSSSIAQVASKLNCNKTGGGYYSLKAAASDLGLTSEHMTGKGWNVGDHFGLSRINRIPLAEILVEHSAYTNTHALKQRLFKEGLKEKKCEWCGIEEWRGQPAPLALDHINGTRRDNRLTNLRILCYNCHGQTETFGRKVRPMAV